MANRKDAEKGGRLMLVATPIGNARDITLRALDALAEADVLAAEDTRTLRRLMAIHGVPLNGRPVIAYHEHSGTRATERLLEHLRKGQSVALVSDAGTPLVADPGYELVRAAKEEGLTVEALPGPSAPVVALAVSGLPTDRFLFGGFLPAASSARRRTLAELVQVPATLVFFETPHRIARALGDAAEILGPDRPAALCRELTKKFEEVRRGSLAELAQDVAANPPRGEIVLVIGRAVAGSGEVSESVLRDELKAALATMSVKDAAATVARARGVPRKLAYRLALELAQGEGEEEA